MLIEESVWIGKIINDHLKKDNFPLLNIGSSTEHFRKVVQPHIHKNIFEAIERRGDKVIHLDMKMEAGVDIVGDLADIKFRVTLKDLGVRSVLCSNLLEHVNNPKEICDSIIDLLKPNDFIIVTTPYSYPFHKDPIDTLFRPSVKELSSYFPGTEIVTSEIVEENETFRKVLMANKKYFLIMLVRWCLPFYKFSEWKLMIKDLLNRNKKFSAACVLLRKK